jgi:ABC-type branched-subunit amino acid transport system permease subunit
MKKDYTHAGLGIALVVVIALWWVMPGWAVNMLALALANGLVVLGLMIQMRAGLVSFGQALYYGIGAYGAAMAGHFWGVTDVFGLLLLGTAASAAVAFILGFLLARYRGIFFAMLSLAFSMILFGLLVNSAALGSTDGFGVSAPTFLGYAPAGNTRLTLLLYSLVALLAYGVAFAANRYLNSTMGYIGEAIRENEVRVDYLGASPRRAIHTKYVIAASVSGMGGVLTALLIGHVTPEDFVYWTKSGEFVFVAILSGTGNVAAPFIGSMIFELVRTYALQYAPNFWQMLLGGTLLAVILFLPGGLWSVVRLLRGRR